jgi:uncharacterized protein (DUF58 family)
MLLLVIDGLALSGPAKQVSLQRTVPPKLFIGRKATVRLQVINHGKKPLKLEIFDGLPPAFFNQSALTGPHQKGIVPALGATEFTYGITPLERGSYRFGKIHARYQSRLGLLWITLQDGQPTEVKVIPDLQRVQRMRIKASRMTLPGELQKRALGMEGTQFSGLRHYFVGDDIKKIAWQSTAKLEQPVIRTFEHEVEQPILVLLDAGRKMSTRINELSKYDQALNAALSLMSVAIDRKDAVGAVVFNNRLVTQVPFGTGAAHWRKLVEKLGATEVQLVEPDYASVLFQVSRGLKRRTLVVLLTDLIDPSVSEQLLQGLKHFSKHHTLLIGALSDPEFLKQAQSRPEDAYQAYQKGVALDLMDLRRQALAVLSRHHRATVIDAPPEKFDEDLIQRYLQLKQRLTV